MRIVSLVFALALVLTPTLVEAKKLKPKYYKTCYADYNDMRKLVPKPPVDVEKKAKTVSAVAGIAGRFGGLGGLGSAASTAATVAQYSETIADVAAFTKSMYEMFPSTRERYLAYGDRMATEAGEMQQVADFAMQSQDCYAEAYTDLKQSSVSGEMKAKDVKKRHKEITIGVGNVLEMLDHATQYMDTNISAYNQALTQETTGAGLNLDKILSLAAQAQEAKASVDGLTPGSGDGWAGTGWTPTEVRIEAHRQAMTAHYSAAGLSDVDPSHTGQAGSLLESFGSLNNIATLGSVDSGLAVHMALEQGIAQANTASADKQMEAAPKEGDSRIEALMEAGGDVQPYLEAYNRIKALNGMQQGVAQFVRGKP